MIDTELADLPEVTAVDPADILYLLDDPSGTPIDSHITVANLLNLECGHVYTNAGVGSQDPGLSFSKITQIDSNGLSLGGVTPDAANNKITVADTGIYLALFQTSFSGTANSTFYISLYWNGVQQVQGVAKRKLGTSGDVGSASGFGAIDVTSGATDIELWAQSDGATDDFNVEELQLFVVRLGST